MHWSILSGSFSIQTRISKIRISANLIPNLQQVVLSSAEQERGTLQSVIEARAAATRPEIQIDGDDLSNPEAMQQYQQAQSQLGGALSRLLVLLFGTLRKLV